MSNPSEKTWDSERQRRNARLSRAASVPGASAFNKVVPADTAVILLEAVLEPGDRVCLEGNNQKRADFRFASFSATTSPTTYSVSNFPKLAELARMARRSRITGPGDASVKDCGKRHRMIV